MEKILINKLELMQVIYCRKLRLNQPKR